MSESEFTITTELKESERYKPWLSLVGAEQLVAQQVGENDDIGDAMVKAATTITEASAKIEKVVVAVMTNQLETEMKRTKAARESAFKITKPVLKRIDDATAYARSAITALEAQTLPKRPKDAIEQLKHQEIRQAIYHLPASERARVVREAISGDDDLFVAAAVTGSPLLTGLGKAEQKLLLHTWQQARFPDKLARLTRLKAGLDQLDRLGPMFFAWSSGLFAQRDAAIASAEHSAALAQSALAEVASA